MLFKKPVAPMPLDRWFANITNVESLRDILNSPTFGAAAATLISAAQPTFQQIINNDEINARRQAWLAGYNDAFNDLMKLTKPPAALGKHSMPAEWDHILREQD